MYYVPKNRDKSQKKRVHIFEHKIANSPTSPSNMMYYFIPKERHIGVRKA